MTSSVASPRPARKTVASKTAGKKSPGKKPTSKKTAAVQVLHLNSLSGLPWLVHAFSTRQGGVSSAYGGESLSLVLTEQDTDKAVKLNQARFLQALDPPAKSKNWTLVSMRQVHSGTIHCLSASAQQLTGDGMVTNTPGVLLAIKTADCLPVLLVDPIKRAVGAFHAGWRGTLSRIVEKGVGEMHRCFGSRPQDIRAAIGPGIHPCCYSIGEEVRDRFSSQFHYADELFETRASDDEVRRKYPLLFMNMRAPGHGEPPQALHLDLVEANRRQLLDAGVLEKNIESSELCTACRTDLLFSHRKERGNTGRMLAVIGIKSGKN